MTDRADLIALLGSRICHDLISPIGAISNGVELMMMDGSAKGPELALISESVANANARIRFFRVAYGAANVDQRIGKPEVMSILSDIGRGGRLKVEWGGPADLTRREVKLVFLLIQCLETAMAYGGRIVVDKLDGRWTVTGTAAKLKVDLELWETLSNPAASTEFSAAQVHFALVPQEVQRQNRRLIVDIDQTELRLTV